ncbi:MAG: ATP-binding cassette domain-containing protein [bacterium]|nr:ATP-binding cassette domain-containing protein [bacterium]
MAELLLEGRGPSPLGRYSLKISSDDRLCVTGGPGSGRTTLCRLLAGVLSPEEGGLTLDGTPYSPPDGRAAAPVGYLPFPAPLLVRARVLDAEIARLLGAEHLFGREGPFSAGENQLLHLGAMLSRGHAFLALDQALAPLGAGHGARVLEFLQNKGFKPLVSCGILLTASEPLECWRNLRLSGGGLTESNP